MQAFVDRFRAKASKARQAQRGMKMLAKMKPIAAMVDEHGGAVQLPRAGGAGAADHRLEDVAVGYDAASRCLQRHQPPHRP